jgi:hypothetical protein
LSDASIEGPGLKHIPGRRGCDEVSLKDWKGGNEGDISLK